jgi:hypothetical protein
MYNLGGLIPTASSQPGLFLKGKDPPVPIGYQASGPQSQTRHGRENKKSLILPEIKPRFLGAPAQGPVIVVTIPFGFNLLRIRCNDGFLRTVMNFWVQQKQGVI